MAGMNVGLISGMDTASLIDQLMAVEANPQTLLKQKLAAAQDDAKAYRTVNTKFDALRAAAEALTRSTTWGAVKATSSASGVTATSTAGAGPGSLTFSVTSLAVNHSILSDKSWAATTDTYDLTLPLAIKNTTTGTSQAITLAAGATLGDVVSAINDQAEGVTAATVRTTTGYRLQLTSTATGVASKFEVGTGFQALSTGADAVLKVGTGTVGYEVSSPTNTLSDVLPGTTLTVTQTGGPVTVTVAGDPEAVTAAVQGLVKAANDVLSSISLYTSTTSESPLAVLKGDSTLRGLANEVLAQVSSAIGGRSAATAGIQLDRYGTIVFNAETFTAALKTDPEIAQKLVSGDSTVPGIAQKLLTLAKKATDSTTGLLLKRAETQDTEAKDLEKRIEDWDRRLELRRATLTRQFTAMETALSSLQNQSSWLSSQLSSLPKWSTSSD
ncbi:flagellar filament capping protein FliD [Geodermatophilus sp. SYSU D01186]